MNERKLLEEVRFSPPEGVKHIQSPTKEIPKDHRYAIVEVIDDSDDGVYFKYVATGDGNGIIEAWDHVQATHPRRNAMRIMDLVEAGDTATPIDFH